jgi:hypothetical protein
MSNDKPTQQTIIACNLSAIQNDQRGQHLTTAKSVLSAPEEVRELEDGYALGLPLDTPMIYKVAEYISNERLCCPFFDFGVDIPAGGSRLWLRLTGGEGVKDFLRAELGEFLRLPG